MMKWSSTSFIEIFPKPTDCRRVFPCWDEPDMKATFELILITKKGLQPLSNTMPIEEKHLPDHWTQTRFEKTPQMSTYLVCSMCTLFKAFK